MASLFDEHAQFVDSAGVPLANGKVYIGTAGGDPVATAGVTTIHSDRALTVSLSNPQTLDALGRATNKIWFDGKYSIQVNDVDGVQSYQNLDAGEATSGTQVVPMGNIAGADTITATGTPTLAAYTDGQILSFTAVLANTGAVTFNADGLGNKAIVKFGSAPLVEGDIVADQSVLLITNTTNDNFELLNPNQHVVQFFEGSAVASAATTDIWSTTGNTIHVTGTTTITSFGTAPNVGARRRVIFDGVVTLTNSANLALPAGTDYTTSAGDIIEVYADTVSQFDVIIHPQTKLPAIDGTLLTGIPEIKSIQVFTASGTWTKPADVRRVLMYVTGGGEGGNNVVAGNPSPVFGGNAGGTAVKTLDVSSISTSTITVGAAGAANLGNGGNSSWADGANTVVGEGGGTGAGNSGHDLSFPAVNSEASSTNSTGTTRTPRSPSYWGNSYAWGGTALGSGGGTTGGVGGVGIVVVMEY